MAQISMDKAAARRSVPLQSLEAWAEQGLLTLHPGPRLSDLAPDSASYGAVEKLVDEDELDWVIESLGWLQLSAPGWP